MESTKQIQQGGGFLIRKEAPENVFTPEDYNEEQLMLRAAIRDFIDQKVEPIKAVFDTKEGTEVAPKILEGLGELGFLGLSVPEKFGGMECDLKTDLATSEIMGDSWAFAQSLGVQRGLAINPLLFYGSPEQQEKYLGDLISGKLKCSYCLTEPGAGSDANAGKTKATLSEDGSHYILNGQKMWITNSGFADIFSVFCKIEDDPNLSCLIVEKEWGVKLGEEENKLGIHGSSTRQVFFENIKVPVENLLGERNKGFKIAMNALNMGRLAIGVGAAASSKRAFNLGVQFANQRVQFGKPISSFGAIQEKIAKMAMYIYALDAAWNRCGSDMDDACDALKAEGLDGLKALQKVAQDFASECSILKVYGSEIEQYIVDEALQMHGGMGFSAESDVSVLYRNIRGNRIYEGTNEINRLVIPAHIIRLAMKGRLPLTESAMNAFGELQAGTLAPTDPSLPFQEFALAYVENCKKATLLVAGQAMQRYQDQLENEQEILHRISDMITEVYLLESAVLRSLKNFSDKPELRTALTRTLMHESAEVLKRSSKEAVFASAEGGMALMSLKAINRLYQLPVDNIIADRRTIAAHFIQENQYKI